MADIRLYNLCLIENPETRQVVAFDKVSSPFAGITLPGGKVEKGESIAASVIREVREETGLTVARLCPAGLVDWVNPTTGARWLLFLYRTRTYSGELIGQTQEGRVFWTDAATFADGPLSPNMDVFWQMYQDGTYREALGTWSDDGLSGSFHFYP